MMRAKYMMFILIIWGSAAAAELDVRAKPFGKTPAGAAVTLYTLTNSNKASAGVIDYGATLVSIRVPDKNGDADDVMLGFDELTQTRGYDHNYVFDNWAGSLALRVTVYEPTTCRVMEVLTTEPGMQLYTANHVRGLKGRGGKDTIAITPSAWRPTRPRFAQ